MLFFIPSLRIGITKYLLQTAGAVPSPFLIADLVPTHASGRGHPFSFL